MSRPFKTPNRLQSTLMPPSIEEWLPQSHLARFVVEIVDQLDLSELYNAYSHTGSRPYDPRMLLSLLFYGYATGVFSSRKIEEATWELIPFRYISGDLHPDHDTIAHFRKRFLKQIEGYFCQILILGKGMGLVKMGTVSIDGTKMQANASKHRAMSYGYMERLEKQLEAEVAQLMELAEQADTQTVAELDIPEELKHRHIRLEKLKQAKKVLEERTRERYEEQQQAYEEKQCKRQEQEKATGKKIPGKKPIAPKDEGPRASDQYNFTDPESRIMKTSSGFDQCYNGQAAVNEQMLILGAYANNHPNDKQELLPVLEAIPPALGKPKAVLADTGYCSEENIKKCIKAEIDPYLAVGRQPHNQYLKEVLEEQPVPDPDAPLLNQMKQKLKTKQGRSKYRLRKMTVEPVFGIIKEVMGFRRFQLRGERQANGEWMLLCTAYNLKRMFNLKNPQRASSQSSQKASKKSKTQLINLQLRQLMTETALCH